MPHPRNKSERARVGLATLCGLGLAVAGAAAAAASVANATVSHFQVNPRTYDVRYDMQKRAYDVVNVSLNGNTMLPDAHTEYAINYGGTCEPGYVLDHSEIRLDIDQSWFENSHEYQQGINYISLANQRFGSAATQSFRARDACNAALQQKLAQGQDLAQALRQRFTVWQVPFFQVQHTLFCRPPNSHNVNAMETSYASATISFDVSCGAAVFPAPQRDPRPSTPGNSARPDDLVHPFAVGAVSLAATQASFQGPCPQEVTFNGTIRVSGNGRVTYKVVGPDGPLSSVELDFTNEAEKIVAFAQRLPATAPVGGFTNRPHPPAPTGPRVTSGTDPNVHTGFFVLQVLSPNRIQSPPAFYRVTCTAGPAPSTLTAPTPAPTAPPPTAAGGMTLALPRPDLVIVLVQPVPGDPLRLRVVLKNQGNAPAPASRVRLAYRRGSQAPQTMEAEVGPLPAGAGRAVVVAAPGPVGAASSVVFKVDSLDQVAESNEGNNEHTYR
jgi:hypothetical protein